MCAVSAVVGTLTVPGSPNYLPFPQKLPSDVAEQLLDVIRRLEEIDRKLGLKDCQLEDAFKEAFKQKLIEAIKTI